MKTIKLSNGQSIESTLNTVTKNTIIELEPRIYYEKLAICTPNITIKGVAGKTKIVFDDYSKKMHADGLEYNTFRTYTVNVIAKNVKMYDLEIENNSYEPKEKGQAVALSVYGDNFYAENVTLKSAQDTLFLGPLPDDLVARYNGFLPDNERYIEGQASSAFVNCRIYGSVDYIFGCGSAYFKDCKLINIDDEREEGFVCAPAHSLKQTQGFTFYNCDFLSQSDCKSTVYLARPWRDWGKCTFIDCNLSPSVSPCGFDQWNDSGRYRTARFEYYNTDIKQAVSWAKKLTDTQKQVIVNTLSEEIKRLSN